MKKMWKAVLAWLLAAVFLIMTGCAGGILSPRAPEATATPPPVSPSPACTDAGDAPSYDELSYQAPDLDALARALDGLMADIEAGKEPAALLDAYEKVLDMFNAADAAAQIAYLFYAKDVTRDDYWTEYTRIDEALLELDLSMTETSIALFESSEEADSLARERLGEGYVEAVYETAPLSNEEVIALLAADSKLQGDYDTLLTTFSFTDGGRAWTFDDILNDDTLAYGDYIRLYDLYCEKLNREAGEIFLELLALRGETAVKLGFGSYAAYRYACYGRDYTVTEARDFHDAVKRYIVPVFLAAEQRSEDVYALYDARYEESGFLDSLAAALAGRSLPSEALHAMRTRGLYDFTVSDKKMESSFTTYISTHRMPYIFMQWENDAGSAATALHEFGHFLNYYANPSAGWSSGDSLDLAEVDSQAFVLLLAPHYEQLFGAEYAQYALTEQLLDALYAIVSGSMEDEFQQCVYAKPDMTLEQMNALYAQLAKEYGMDALYGYTGTEWTLIPHTFQSPMYYISYAVSMLAALEIWSALENGEAEAWEQYWGVMMRAPYAEFRAALKENGLDDPLSAATVKRLAELIDSSIQ